MVEGVRAAAGHRPETTSAQALRTSKRAWNAIADEE